MQPISLILIRPLGRFFTAVGELKDVTEDDEVMANSRIIDCGEIKPGETARDAALRKREKYRYEERFSR